MKKRQLYTARMAPISHEAAQDINKRFPIKEVRPGVSQEELLFNAGQRDVVNYILRSASGTTVSGDVSEIKPHENSRSLLARLLGNRQ